MPVLKYICDTKWQLKEDLKYNEHTVPKGFITDMASVPRILWSIFPPFGKYLRASIFHDYLLLELEKKKEAHIIFREIMIEDGVKEWKANLFYLAVLIYHKLFDKKT